jgi:putative CRISPR-associated protein (TIGR02619 family)
MRKILICTVGTSLLNNLKREEGELKQACLDNNWQKLSLLLLEKNSSDRVCGAEINSIASICKQNLLSEYFRLIFLVSDTEDGLNIGDLLKLYYESSSVSPRFKKVEIRTLKGLRDDNVKAFKQEGLKNLVKEISQEVSKFSPETIAINATGGYKAQISFAGMIGQALGIPVYYLFERFSEVIELPPQPIALDLAFWLNNYGLFERLESEITVEKCRLSDLNWNDEYCRSLIDEESINGETLVSLSAMGILFNERSRLQFAQQETTMLSLIPKTDISPEQKPIDLRDDRGKDVLQEFAEKIRRSPYVTEIINSLPYNPKQRNAFKKAEDNGKIEFVLHWTDRGLGIVIQTTGRNLAETTTIALHLQEKFTK